MISAQTPVEGQTCCHSLCHLSLEEKELVESWVDALRVWLRVWLQFPHFPEAMLVGIFFKPKFSFSTSSICSFAKSTCSRQKPRVSCFVEIIF